MGSNQQPLDYSPNALPTELRRDIRTFTVQRYSELQCYTSLRHSCIIILYENMYERVLVDVNI